MTGDTSRQERVDFDPTENRDDPWQIEHGEPPDSPQDEARDSGDWSDPRVAQEGDAQRDRQ